MVQICYLRVWIVLWALVQVLDILLDWIYEVGFQSNIRISGICSGQIQSRSGILILCRLLPEFELHRLWDN